MTENKVIPAKAGIQERHGCPTDKLGHDRKQRNQVIPAKAGIQERRGCPTDKLGHDRKQRKQSHSRESGNPGKTWMPDRQTRA